jgi:site-specific recombinase XerD
MLLKDVTPDKAATYLENKLGDGLKPATVAHHLALLKHSFTMAVTWGLLPANPIQRVKLPAKVNNVRIRYLTPQEVQRLLAVCPSHLRRIALTALYTGMRKNEILTLQWKQIQRDQSLVLLTDTKNGETRGVPLNSAMLSLLQEIQEEQKHLGFNSPYVFVNLATEKPYRRDADTAWYTALKKAELTNVHFHDLRHITASHMRMQGVDLFTIKEVLGHKDLRMTARYAHVGQPHRLAAVAALERAYQLPAPEKQ